MADESSNATEGPVVLAVAGMTCDGCAGTVARVLAAVPGVRETRVDLARGRATVAGTARLQDLVRALQAAGFGAGPG
jgi:copper chaperone CopZ